MQELLLRALLHKHAAAVSRTPQRALLLLAVDVVEIGHGVAQNDPGLLALEPQTLARVKVDDGLRAHARLELSSSRSSSSVAMAWGEGTSATDAGAARYVLERELGIPVAPIRVGTLSQADLGRYDVLILPDAGWGFEGEFGAGGMSAPTGPEKTYMSTLGLESHWPPASSK